MQTFQALTQKIAELQKEMKQKMKRLPYILGTEAVRMARKQIDQGGTINNGFTQWPQRKQQAFMAVSSKLGKNSEGKLEHVAAKIKFTDQGKHNNNRGILNPGGKMYRAIKYQVSDNTVSVGVDLKTIPYAQIHNEGGKIPITPKMRGYFMAKFRETGNPFWFNMSRHKGNTITMPKRQFLAMTPELKAEITKTITTFLDIK
jgi:phage gpG-like protein